MATGGEVMTNFSTVIMREKSASTKSPNSSVRNCYSLDVSPFGVRHRRRISKEYFVRRRTLKDVLFKIFSKSEKFRKSTIAQSRNYQVEVEGDEHAVITEIKHVKDIKELPLELCLLENIQELHLSSNNIQRLTHIEYCRNLRLLDVSQNKILELEAGICSLKKLNTLNLNGNRLSTLPMEIEKLYNLQHLFISANRLRSIPFGIKNIRTMQNLDLSRNRIDLIDEDFFENLQYLECAVLSDNQLSRIPDSILKCSNLKNLYLRKNRFKFVPASLCDVEKLETLNISDNYIRKYNVSLRSLRKLFLGSNELSDLSDSIADSVDLVTLSIENNNFETFPRNVLKLSKLRNLNLSSNANLADIPSEINSLKNLRHLNLETTRTSCISRKLLTRSHLRLSVAGSLFSSEFQEMSDAGVEALKEFLASKNYQLPDLSNDIEDVGFGNDGNTNFDDNKDDTDVSDSEYVNDQYHDNVRCRQFSILKLS
ncbi:DgyrCDS9650 [Dimorphilus gyrociliatus]|uniref:DgyrCDS9650 n=1 Tax=Dimorphilus gyrociliatus TaxID=2664684 RepID=A0A7I8VZ93_9ANNE|nr:DgyrCDS9650 [Dimorphilus gyrociliatus]